MAPPKRDSGDAAGMRAISSFFAPKTNIVVPEIGTASAEKHGGKALKTSSSDAPGSNARSTEQHQIEPAVVKTQATDQHESPDPPATASAKKFREVRRRSSDFAGAEANKGAVPSPKPAPQLRCSKDDVGRRVAVFWPSEKKFYPARVAAVDTTRGKHHLRYDDGDDEWINLSKRKTCWDLDAELVASERFENDEELVSEKGDDDDDDDDSDSDDDKVAPQKKARVRVTLKGQAAKAALAGVASKKPARGSQKASKNRKVVLSDSDSDFAGEDAEESGGDGSGSESESEFEVESDASDASDEDDDAESESESEFHDDPPKRKRGGGGKTATKKSVPKLEKKPSVSAAAAARARIASASPAAPPKASAAPASLLPVAGKARALGATNDFTERMERGGAGGVRNIQASGDVPCGDGLTSGLAGPARYADREKRMFPWLSLGKRKDLDGRRPTDPGYDPSTLALPMSFPKCVDSQKNPFVVSPGQAQWWRFKSQHFDAVIMFKMGKFYELFEMDAHVGAADLGLAYMKGEQPHCGFPEKNYAANAERLARAGHRVVVVEQVETPAQLAERRAAGTTKDSVVKRAKVGILTKGTLVDVAMCEASPDASYVVSLVELGGPLGNAPTEDDVDANDDASPWIGVCAADCATGRFLVGAWRDDASLGGVRAALAALMPVELVAPPGGFSARMRAAARDTCPTAAVRRRRGDDAVSTAAGALALFAKGEYFLKTTPKSPAASPMKGGKKNDSNSVSTLPPALASFADDDCAEKRDCALGAFGAMTQYLKDAMLDLDLVPLGRVERLPGPEDASSWTHGGFVHLDAAALHGLEILEDSSGGTDGSLLTVLDRCASAGGRRLLRRWITRPLRSAAAVRARQLAVRDLRTVGVDAIGKARGILKKACDLERVVSRLVGVSGGRGRDAADVVLYEDAQKERLKGFTQALEGMAAATEVTRAFDEVRGALTSNALRLLVTQSGNGVDGGMDDGMDDAMDSMDIDAAAAPPKITAADTSAVGGVSMPALDATLGFFQNAFDWETAKQNGRIAPKPGADASVDAADARVAAADEALQAWLQNARALLGGSRDACVFASANKDTYLLEVPDRLAHRVPAMWSREGKKKGFERFDSPDLTELRLERANAEEAREVALAGVLRALTKQFCDEWPRWRRAAETCAALDALSSLAVAAEELAAVCQDTCTPSVVESLTDTKPFLTAERMRHPCVAILPAGDAFVPNDVNLGGFASHSGGKESAESMETEQTVTQTHPPLVLLTGPNMGGKSTLLRQICLCAVMAHVGADVPAKSFSMSATDAVYVRMGARDDVAGGKSTFMVELSETAAMLRRCTATSLIALDELGRGTSTSDGFAIASAVVNTITKVGSRTLFATHYHRLAEEFEDDKVTDANQNKVALAHMGCDVRRDPVSTDQSDSSEPLERVTFLYTLEKGSCPKSYGVNVARLAGLPESVLSAASKRSAALEANSNEKRARNDVERVATALVAVGASAGDESKTRAAWAQAKTTLAICERE